MRTVRPMILRSVLLGLGIALATVGLLAIVFAVAGQGWWFGAPCLVAGALLALPGLVLFRERGWWRGLAGPPLVVVLCHFALLGTPEFHLLFVRQTSGEGPGVSVGLTGTPEPIVRSSGLTLRILRPKPLQRTLEVECDGSVQEIAYLAMPSEAHWLDLRGCQVLDVKSAPIL